MKVRIKLRRPGPKRGLSTLPQRCSLLSCPSTVLQRNFQKRDGIKVGREWYCSVDCLAAGARTLFSSLLSGNVLQMPHTPRLSIGLTLLSKGALTEDQLRSAVTESELCNETLENTLMRLGLADERKITAARAAQWGCPVMTPDREIPHVESDLPTTLLQRYSAVPLHTSATAKRILLGFVYRVEHGLLTAMEEVTGLRTEPCFITATEYLSQLRRMTNIASYEEIVFEEAQVPGQMARNVGGFALEIGAKELRLVRCRDYAWTRLIGRRGTIDLLFRMESAARPVVIADSFAAQEPIRSLG